MLVATIFYQIISMLKGTRAAQILIGLSFIFIAYLFSSMLQLETLHWLINKFYASFIIFIIVLFQDDIRRILTRFGKGPFLSGIEIESGDLILTEVCNAAKNLSHDRIGALVVFERGISLDKLHDHSVPLDSVISEQLLISIFQSFSPLHDGAVIVRKNRIICASAQLPLSKNPRFSRRLGTRHSAAVGISEETDAVVLVVSEETGNISIAWEGNMQKQHSPEATKKTLSHLLMPKTKEFSFSKWFEEKLSQRDGYSGFKGFKNKGHAKKAKHHHHHHHHSLIRTVTKEHAQLPEENQIIEIASENTLATYTSAKGQNAPAHPFPKYSKLDDLRLTSDHLVLSNSVTPEPHSPPLMEEEPILEPHTTDEELFQGEDLRNRKNNQVIAIEKNEAAKALSELSLEDRFVPPMPSAPPPRDVSIGGVSLNPPLETALNGAKKTPDDLENSKQNSSLKPKEAAKA